MIDSFRGEFGFLSNFYAAPAAYQGVVYPTSEHAFQAAKTLDPKERKQIQRASTPKMAKQLGRRVTLRPNWDNIRVAIMAEIVLDKFTRNPELAELLVETGDEVLVEGNTWNDFFWGQVEGKGQNWLGRILMAVRKQLVESK